MVRGGSVRSAVSSCHRCALGLPRPGSLRSSGIGELGFHILVATPGEATCRSDLPITQTPQLSVANSRSCNRLGFTTIRVGAAASLREARNAAESRLPSDKTIRSHVALDNVSFEVAAGSAAVILGPSGCGKTTLLRIISGLEVPDTGHVLLNDTTVSDAGRTIVPPHQRRLGFVFQDLALWPHLTVRENLILLGRELFSGDRKRRARRHWRFRIEQFSNVPEPALRRKTAGVALARAIVGEPRVMLLDGPIESGPRFDRKFDMNCALRARSHDDGLRHS